MKIISIVAIAAAGLAAPVLAADPSLGPSYPVTVRDRELPAGPSYVVPVFGSDPGQRPLTKASPAVAAAFSWTSCYIGALVGGEVSKHNTTNSFGSSIDSSSAGFVGGGQIGCDYQFSGRWIVGIEGRAAATSSKNSHPTTATNFASGTTVPAQFTLSSEFLASSTARLGYSFADCWLVYVRGGGAWTHEKVDQAFTTVGGTVTDPRATLARAGWTVGTGVEWAFAPNWSATLEYNYYDFGTKGVKLVDTTSNVSVSGLSLKDSVHAATVGVNRRF
jgi:outer membrane immunogenic protein